MLDLRSVARALDAQHQRFVDESLPKELSVAGFEALNLRGYSQGEIARARAAWEGRALAAKSAQVGAAQFLGDLVESGTSRDILGVATRVMRDKDRHLEIARRFVCKLGGSSVIKGTAALPTRSTKGPTQGVLRAILFHLCLNDTVAARLYASMGKTTENATAKVAIDLMAGDTAISSQLGWAMLDVILPALEDAELVSLRARMPRAFTFAEQTHLPNSPAPGTQPGRPIHPFGAQDLVTRGAVFHDAITHITERFERLGLPGKSAWRTRPRTQTQFSP